MPHIVSPPEAVQIAEIAARVAEPPVARTSQVVRLEAESERLQREVRAASVRNTGIAEQSTAQARQVKTFEERTRDTLRDLVARMQQDDEQHGR